MNNADYTNLMNLLHAMSNKLDTIIKLLGTLNEVSNPNFPPSVEATRLFSSRLGDCVNVRGSSPDHRIVSPTGEDE